MGWNPFRRKTHVEDQAPKEWIVRAVMSDGTKIVAALDPMTQEEAHVLADSIFDCGHSLVVIEEDRDRIYPVYEVSYLEVMKLDTLISEAEQETNTLHFEME